MTEDTGERISIISLLGGEAARKLDEELEKAVKNILQGDTEAEAKREVYLTITMKPNEARDVVKTIVKVESKLAGPSAEGTTLFLGMLRNGEVVATEHNPKQGRLFEDRSPSSPKLIKAEEG